MDELSQQVLDLLHKWDYDEDYFDTDQLTEIYLGLKNGLTEAQVYAYMSPKLTVDQMMFCRQCSENGSSPEQINQVHYINPHRRRKNDTREKTIKRRKIAKY